MSRSRKASARISLSGTGLDGYSGTLDIVSFRKRTWWDRLLRRRRFTSELVYGNVRGDSARIWRKA